MGCRGPNLGWLCAEQVPSLMPTALAPCLKHLQKQSVCPFPPAVLAPYHDVSLHFSLLDHESPSHPHRLLPIVVFYGLPKTGHKVQFPSSLSDFHLNDLERRHGCACHCSELHLQETESKSFTTPLQFTFPGFPSLAKRLASNAQPKPEYLSLYFSRRHPLSSGLTRAT